MMATEGIELRFDDGALREISDVAALVNQQMEDIGARRLHTVMEKLLEEMSFVAPEMKERKEEIDKGYVEGHLSDIVKDRDLTRYIL